MTFRSGLAALFTAASLIAAPATADTYPERAVEFIVPWSPGGGSDTLMRLVANNVQPFLGAEMPVINMPGVGGTVGLREASRRAADASRDRYAIGHRPARARRFSPVRRG